MSRHKGSRAMVAIKLNVEKAYDSISWPFLEACLVRFGFHESFVAKIMKCVTSVQYKIRVKALFSPSRGLRQGDPLSRYLYIICVEALTRHTTSLSNANKMLFPKIAPGGQKVGLLQFADDLLFFLHLNDRHLMNLTKTLQLFEEEAGQRINKSKSQLLFPMNTTPGVAR
ncbi:hypothetical protein MRB53_003143 [Persea americana]|uniref:Uncharacterized protein n=1 Tax=Persea americana TaxID=3435 RepID=A0ACC2MXF1_PERAE|nr:hypothetical protein MRB53_003143 [Persea americana]